MKEPALFYMVLLGPLLSRRVPLRLSLVHARVGQFGPQFGLQLGQLLLDFIQCFHFVIE